VTSTAGPVLAFHHLSFAPEGDDVVVGRRDIDSYGVFPADGAALVRELAAGRPVPDAARWYEDTYGEPVDVDAFVDTLSELEFLRPADVPLAAVEPVRWQRLARTLFSPVAAVLYGMVVAAAIGISLGDPSLAPRPGNVFFVGSFVIVELTIVIGQLPLSGIHELAHLLAGRRLGLRSRIRLSNRFYFVVFETTLDGLVSVPRRRRFLHCRGSCGRGTCSCRPTSTSSSPPCSAASTSTARHASGSPTVGTASGVTPSESSTRPRGTRPIGAPCAGTGR
jgi:hypothetical protein